MNTTTTTPAAPALKVYKASAGSGKTFTLAVEYIKLLIDNPLSARTILAVTFTNKATDEMKTRILSQLYGLWRRLPSSADYLGKIIEGLWGDRLTPDDHERLAAVVAQRAGIALRDILHHYSYFRIQTIDTFFQSVLRNLARELDLTANWRVELNQNNKVEQQAVDAMINNLHDNDATLLWILDYIKDKIDEDRGWNVIGDIKDFGRNIFKEFYKSNSQRLNAVILKPNFFRDFNDRMHAIRRQAAKQMADVAADFFRILDENLLDVGDFSSGSRGICGYFLKLADGTMNEKVLTKTVQEAIDSGDPYKWVKRTEKNKAEQLRKLQLVNDVLQPKLVSAEALRKKAWSDYQSATLTLRHIRQLYLLNSIEKQVRQENADTNSFLLSDTQTLLNALIKDNDTPFIFEKIGTRIAHIMIDEFQDTSVVQWSNFRVLLRECMSHATGGNLIVGDVKQSIYRWRSGDWRLLNNIERQFDGTGLSVQTEPLATNYRSMRRVVAFNNAFFTAAAAVESHRETQSGTPGAEQLQRAYEEVVQLVPKQKADDGYVSVELLPKDDLTEQTLSRLVSTVHELLGMGVEQRDIAIIVRENSTIQTIADHFMRNCPEVSVVSDEAFKLGNSQAVCMLVGALRLLVNPDDLPTKAFLAKAYQQTILGRDFLLSSAEELDDLLPAAFTHHTESLRTTPLYELAERLFTIFSLEKLSGQDAYLHTFFDTLSDFILTTTTDMAAFLEEWESRFRNTSIQADSVGGIRMLTIHKSKGLECDNVLLPFCNWKLEKTNLVWCSPKEEPFSQLPLVPIDFSVGSTRGTVYEAECLEEHLQNCVDNLNLLYVAFTRAKKRLFVFGQRGANASFRSQLVEQCLSAVADKLPGSTMQGADGDAQEPLLFEYGDIRLAETRKQAKPADDNVFLPTVQNIGFALRSNELKAEFRQSNKSREFTLPEEPDSEAQQQRAYIQTGNVLHQLFSSIRTAADIDRAIRAMEANGTLQESGMTAERVGHLIHSRVSSPQVADWFSGRWTLFNECTILARNELTGECVEQRPDRVMADGDRVVIVDFKFGTPRSEYADQVRRYMSLVKSMDTGKHVEGYLWFVYSNQIIPVE